MNSEHVVQYVAMKYGLISEVKNDVAVVNPLFYKKINESSNRTPMEQLKYTIEFFCPEAPPEDVQILMVAMLVFKKGQIVQSDVDACFATKEDMEKCIDLWREEAFGSVLTTDEAVRITDIITTMGIKYGVLELHGTKQRLSKAMQEKLSGPVDVQSIMLALSAQVGHPLDNLEMRLLTNTVACCIPGCTQLGASLNFKVRELREFLAKSENK